MNEREGRGQASQPVVLDALNHSGCERHLDLSVLLRAQDFSKIDAIDLVGRVHLFVGTRAVLAAGAHAHAAPHKRPLVLGTAG